MKYSLKSKLSFSYAVMSLLMVALISFCINVLLQSRFQDYVIKEREQKNTEIVSMIEKQYNGLNGGWNTGTIENIGVSALEQGVIVRLKDAKGKTVWDATVHNNGLCVQMLTHMSENMNSRYPGFKGGYEQKTYSLKSGGQEVGHAELGYYGPYYFTDNDIAFLNSLNSILIAVGVLSLIMALILGAFMAKRVSGPISKSIRAAGQIAKGNFQQRITESSGTREMAQLTDTINHLADSLEKQQDLRKRMAADVAHELRTPLANLQSSMEAMLDGIWEPSEERLESCHEEIIRLNRLVGDLEKLERYEAENASLTISVFDLSGISQLILNNFESEFRKKGIALHFEGKSVTVQADRDKITQVITNLVSNALKYTPEDGNVSVSVQESERGAELSVADTGKGIPPEDLPYIFERFYRADRSRNRRTGGLGLGLTITKAIVDAHGGTIEVVSEVDRGTTFTVTLPKD
ncbi:HAMP domain-containing histidine kinase [Caproiciproducens sp. AGMB10547]|uniref:histidine kinase n=1 Tax=Caproiciproducens faecalis TaxID=2820301 RepID=A0ABS7DJJ7_9FIRM|nr:ATP-binding protein [Caproiciproducens faecalis]MBW7571468.1 HAMP domain-containing histidine kinase [Caproiciproducens faecalis]